MKNSFLFSLAISLFSALHTSAQVQIDHQIQLTGTGSNASITGIQQVTDSSAATYARAIQNGGLIYAADMGSANSYAVTLAPAISSYIPGMIVNFIALNANTGVSTLSVNGLPPATIKKQVTTDLAANDILANQAVSVMYDGTNFQMLAELGNSTTSIATSPCTLTPGTASAGSSSVACGSNVTLTLTGYSTSAHIQWMESTNAANYTNVPSGTGASVTALVYNSIMYFIAQVSNANGSCATVYSNVVTVSGTGAACDPIGCDAYGGTGADYGVCVIKTTDGGYAMEGSTASFAVNNVSGTYTYIIKTDSGGNMLWNTVIGGKVQNTSSIIQTTDGGYAVASSTTTSSFGNNDFYIIKLNAAGSVSWAENIGGTGDDEAQSIIQTSDGGYAVAGFTTSFGAGSNDFYIVKLDGSGNILWTTTVGGSSDDDAYSIVQTSDGGYAVAGKTSSYGGGSYDFYIVKLNASGTVLWTTTVGGTGDDEAYSIVQNSDLSLTAAGIYGTGNRNAYLVNLSSSGSLNWANAIGVSSSSGQYFTSVLQTSDGGWIAAGETGSTGLYAVKLNSSENITWSQDIDGSNYYLPNTVGSIIQQTNDGGYIVTGGTAGSSVIGNVDFYLSKLNSSGSNCCSASVTSTSASAGSITSTNHGTSNSGGSVKSVNPAVTSGGSMLPICH